MKRLGFTSCRIEVNRMGHITITFPDGRDIYLQHDMDIASLIQDMGVEDVDDLNGATECPDYYVDLAEPCSD